MSDLEQTKALFERAGIEFHVTESTMSGIAYVLIADAGASFYFDERGMFTYDGYANE